MKKGLFLLLLALLWFPLRSQTLARNDQLKLDADYYLMEGDFNKALSSYLTVLKTEPDNADVKYRIGICYLNSEDEKDKAIGYLEEAAQKVSEKHNQNSFKEVNAPVDALFLLGSAYRISNRLDEAITAYTNYKNYLDPQDAYNLSVVDQYLKSCEMARNIQERPIKLISTNIGKPVNTEQPNYNAVFSGDGKVLLYTTPGRTGYDIFYTTLGDTAWTTPKNITSILGTGKFMVTADLSDDGQTLLLALDDPVNADIYMSKFNKGRWSKVEPLGKEINSKYNETYASLSPDGKELYFTSDRKGGLGDMDIYKSVVDSKGSWGKPVNMGPGINTPFNEASPFMAESVNRLYFSSEGHDGIGGFDIFYYDLDNPGLGAINLGYPLNTTDNDLFYVPRGDGTSGYFSFRGNDTYGGRDIYSIMILPPDEIPVAVAEVTEEPVNLPEIVTPPAQTAQVLEVEEDLGIEQNAVVEEISPVTVEQPAPPETEVPAEIIAPIVEERVYEETVPDLSTASAVSYRIQIMALKKPVDLAHFRELSGISITYTQGQWYRYSLGNTTDRKEAEHLLSEIISKGYEDAFIRGNNIYPQYTIQVMAVPGPVIDLSRFSNLTEILVTKGTDNFCRYSTGEFATKEEALNDLNRVKSMGYGKAFVTKIR